VEIKEMIAVLSAAERGEQIEYEVKPDLWMTTVPEWDFSAFDYRIAPKKEMTLVEELRLYYDQHKAQVYKDAADRIHILEEMLEHPVESVSTDELLAELKRRVKK
jgi:hypothetical protein